MRDTIGPVESGVLKTFEALLITIPSTAMEQLAVRLAQAIDNAKYAKDLPPLAHQLIMTMEKVAAQPSPTVDATEQMAARY